MAPGFLQGDASPNVFDHTEKSIAISVHRDDFSSSGPAPAQDVLETSVAEHYESTIAPRMGKGPDEAKEGRMLNHVIRWCEASIEYECEPRQIEKFVTECGPEGSKPQWRHQESRQLSLNSRTTAPTCQVAETPRSEEQQLEAST